MRTLISAIILVLAITPGQLLYGLTTGGYLYKSPILKEKGRNEVDISVDITGVKRLYLIVHGDEDRDNDHATWLDPYLIGSTKKMSLTKLKWKHATCYKYKVMVGTNADGSPLRKGAQTGIGTHAQSVISYDLPAGFTQFTAKGVISKISGHSSFYFIVAGDDPTLFNRFFKDGKENIRRSETLDKKFKALRAGTLKDSDSEGLLYVSEYLSAESVKEVDIEVNIAGVKWLYLIVDGAGNPESDSCAWLDPVVIGTYETLSLTDLDWKYETSEWRDTKIGKLVNGDRLPTSAYTGIGTHAQAVIVYELPDGFTNFQAKGVLTSSSWKAGVYFVVGGDHPGLLERFVARKKKNHTAFKQIEALLTSSPLKSSSFMATQPKRIERKDGSLQIGKFIIE